MELTNVASPADSCQSQREDSLARRLTLYLRLLIICSFLLTAQFNSLLVTDRSLRTRAERALKSLSSLSPLSLPPFSLWTGVKESRHPHHYWSLSKANSMWQDRADCSSAVAAALPVWTHACQPQQFNDAAVTCCSYVLCDPAVTNNTEQTYCTASLHFNAITHWPCHIL